MSSSSRNFLLPLLIILLVVPRISGDDGGQDDPGQQWCIADVQTPDNELQMAINWACGQQDVKCDMIQENQSCFQPNTTKDHADFVFNSYFQNHKTKVVIATSMVLLLLLS